ncbi:MAG TPA: transketolase C-terminal domain-containing protein, partial [Burkholderiaceae bacterium]|nr:transketolase C-terminal domain-containing protein [Burkholderiaceae bacterium]
VREGRDVTVISYSRTMLEVNAVADELAKRDISVEVIDLRSISPLDMDSLRTSVAKTRRAVVAHEAQVDFGVGAEIAARLQQDLFGQLLAPVGRVGAARSPVPFSKALETAYLPTAERISAAILQTLA